MDSQIEPETKEEFVSNRTVWITLGAVTAVTFALFTGIIIAMIAADFNLMNWLE